MRVMTPRPSPLPPTSNNPNLLSVIKAMIASMQQQNANMVNQHDLVM